VAWYNLAMSEHPPIAQQPDKGRSVRQMFDTIAPRYDLLNRVLSLGIDRGWRKAAVRSVTAGKPNSILDVATGTADLAIALKRFSPSSEVIGVDFSEPMLERGRVKATDAGVDVTLEVGDGLALGYPDASFEAVSIAFGLRNFSDVEAGLREFRRVLAPGGRLVVLEFPPPPRGLFGWFFRLYFMHVVPRLGRWISGHASAYRYLPASTTVFPQPEALREAMLRAGFEVVTWTPFTFGVAAMHVADVGTMREEVEP